MALSAPFGGHRQSPTQSPTPSEPDVRDVSGPGLPALWRRISRDWTPMNRLPAASLTPDVSAARVTSSAVAAAHNAEPTASEWLVGLPRLRSRKLVSNRPYASRRLSTPLAASSSLENATA